MIKERILGYIENWEQVNQNESAAKSGNKEIFDVIWKYGDHSGNFSVFIWMGGCRCFLRMHSCLCISSFMGYPNQK